MSIAHDVAVGNVWYWQGDGEDHLESLTCPVVISPEDLAELVAIAERAREVERELLIEGKADPWISAQYTVHYIINGEGK